MIEEPGANGGQDGGQGDKVREIMAYINIDKYLVSNDRRYEMH